MSARQKIRFGIIGLGLMGKEFAAAAARWPELIDLDVEPEIVGICDSNAALFGWYERNFPSIRVKSTDYRDLLNSSEIDAIYCAVPHNLHQQVYIDIVRAGKHLLGEKPFGIDAAANAAILDEITRHPKVFVACSSEFPFFPGAQRLIRAIREGRFGQIIEVSAGLLHSSDLDPNKKINWKRMVEVNGEYGCMGDLGMHPLHIPLRAGWLPRAVSASLVKIVTQRPDGSGQMVPCKTWDNATFSGMVSGSGGDFPLTIQTYRISPGDTNTWYLRILGTEHSAEFSSKSPKAYRWMDYRSGREQAWQQIDLGYEAPYSTIHGGIFEFGFADAILQMWAAFCDELAHGRDGMRQAFHCATPEETRQHHAVLTAALQSHALGVAVAPQGRADR